jgi:hypothetical protein
LPEIIVALSGAIWGLAGIGVLNALVFEYQRPPPEGGGGAGLVVVTVSAGLVHGP